MWPLPGATSAGWRRPATVIALGVGGGASVAAVAFALSSRDLRSGARPDDSQAMIAARNERIARHDSAAVICGNIAVTAIVTGAFLLLWRR